MTGREIIKLDNGAQVSADNIEAQFSLLKMFKLPLTMATTHKVERKDGHWTLIKRETPVDIFADDDGRMRVVAQVQKTQSEKIGLSRTRGKYGDEGRLYDQDCASLAVGEVDAWGTI